VAPAGSDASPGDELPAIAPQAGASGASPGGHRSLDESSLGRRFAPPAGRCEFCGHVALDRHCKVVCPGCGAVRDCSDP
jgi:hypothetical protein